MAGARLLQGLAPVVGRDAKLLILGSFPGEASLLAGQYYAHPRNQFWPLLGRLIGADFVNLNYLERLERVRAHRIAIWDSAAACRRVGSLDSAMRDIEIGDFSAILSAAPGIGAVAFNGKQAARLGSSISRANLRTYALPSTSPAHAAMTFEAKVRAWSVLRQHGWL